MPIEVPEIPIVPEQDPGQENIPILPVHNPIIGISYAVKTVSGVPENVMGWLVAQGWEITGITSVPGTTPPTNYFSLRKNALDTERALLDLCNNYTTEATTARVNNGVRYNQVVANWDRMIETSHDHFDNQTKQQNDQAGIFFTDLDDYMTAIDTLIADNQTELGLDATEARTALVGMDFRLTELEDNAAANAVVINDLLTVQESNLQSYITDYDARLAQLQQNVTDHISTVLAKASELGVVLEAHVVDYAEQFDSIVANYSLYLVGIELLLANISNNVNGYVSEVTAILDEMDTDYTSVASGLEGIKVSAGSLVTDHVTDYAAILALLSSDYASQSSTIRSVIGYLAPDHFTNTTITRGITDSLYSDFLFHNTESAGLLNGLGVTEIARINEEFVARLSVQLQALVTRGLSTATLITDITERNHRDRDEQIQLLMDRLNREKFDNQHRVYDQQRVMRTQTMDNEHRLYEQQRAMRAQVIDAESRLYEQQAGMRTRTLDGKNQLHTVQQEVLRYQASLISGTYALLQESHSRVLAGKQAILSARDAAERLGIEVRSRLYGQLQDVQQKVIESTDRIYQLRDVYKKFSNAEEHTLYGQLQQVKQQFVESVERQLASKQNVTRAEMAQRDVLLQQLQAALTGLLGGKERFSSLLMQNANTLSEHKHRAIVERMNTATRRLDGWKSIADENRKLLAYQLDERNKLLIGLYQFVEKRDDVAPEWMDMAKMIAGLGDSAGGWVTP